MRNCIWEPDQDCINKINEHDIPNAIPPKGHHQADWKDNLSLLYPLSQVLWWVSLVILCCVRRLGSVHMRCMAPVGLNNGLDSNDLWLFTLEANLAMYIWRVYDASFGLLFVLCNWDDYSCLIFEAAASHLQSWGDRARTVAVLWPVEMDRWCNDGARPGFGMLWIWMRAVIKIHPWSLY